MPIRNVWFRNPTMVSRRAARKFNSRYSAGSMAVWPVSMAHSVARPKNRTASKMTAATVLTAARRLKNPNASASRHSSPPTTRNGMPSITRPDRALVTNRHVRSTGSVCISPTALGEYR